jgi:hypothetical protein
MAYPTELFAEQADHTYVKCRTGRHSWGCWGGQSGGTELRRGQGGTVRANKIAQPDERAGIKCYLINGVCHQAANRILLPAGITVRGARGYSISESLFGTYGKVGSWPCKSPFHQYQGVTGDLPGCDAVDEHASEEMSAAAGPLSDADERERMYIQEVLEMYSQGAALLEAESETEAVDDAQEFVKDFSVKLFMHMAAFHLGDILDEALSKSLTDVRSKTEMTRASSETAYAKKEMSVQEYADEFDTMTIRFQDEMAGIMKPDQYEAIFDLKPDERVVLTDREILKELFGDK